MLEALPFKHFGAEREHKFIAGYHYASQPFFVLTLTIVLFSSLPYGFLDLYLIPGSIAEVYVVRYLIWVPLILFLLYKSFSSDYIKHSHWYATAIVSAIGFGVIYMVYLSSEQELSFTLYYSGIAVAMILMIPLRVRFWRTVVLNILFLVAYLAVALLKQGMWHCSGGVDYPAILFNNLFFLVSFAIGSSMSAYVLEQYARNIYFKHEMILVAKKLSEEKNLQLVQRNEEIIAQRDEIIAQKEVIEQHHLQITDSIAYASLIQNAALPDDAVFQEYFPDSFVFYRPKGVVSGDFYWVSEIGNKRVLAVADCTGHGVPGALMSMLGISFLNELASKRISESNRLLDQLRLRVKQTLKQGGTAVKDSMDVSLVVFDPENRQLQFSGAYNPLYILRDGKVIVIRGDRQPIGAHVVEQPFSAHTFELLPGDAVYLFSDGYADQIGGPENRKFLTRNFRQLLAAVSSLPVAEQKSVLENQFNRWCGDEEQVDDVLVVGLSF